MNVDKKASIRAAVILHLDVDVVQDSFDIDYLSTDNTIRLRASGTFDNENMTLNYDEGTIAICEGVAHGHVFYILNTIIEDVVRDRMHEFWSLGYGG